MFSNFDLNDKDKFYITFPGKIVQGNFYSQKGMLQITLTIELFFIVRMILFHYNKTPGLYQVLI